jgi:hypothetical protein
VQVTEYGVAPLKQVRIVVVQIGARLLQVAWDNVGQGDSGVRAGGPKQEGTMDQISAIESLD